MAQLGVQFSASTTIMLQLARSLVAQPQVCQHGPTLRNGSSGNDVKAAQYLLRSHGHSLTVDGEFGAGTEQAVRSFQSANGLTADGIVGAQTFAKLIKTVQNGSNGDAVRAIQSLLGVTVDGAFGAGTEQAVLNLQSTYGLTRDGVVGPLTWQAAFGK